MPRIDVLVRDYDSARAALVPAIRDDVVGRVREIIAGTGVTRVSVAIENDEEGPRLTRSVYVDFACVQAGQDTTSAMARAEQLLQESYEVDLLLAAFACQFTIDAEHVDVTPFAAR